MYLVFAFVSVNVFVVHLARRSVHRCSEYDYFVDNVEVWLWF